MAKISFEADRTGFPEELKSRVNTYFKETGRSTKATWGGWIKAWFFILGSALNYWALVWGGFEAPTVIALCVFQGFLIAGVGFNVMHDAVHGNFSRKKWLNSLMSLSMEMFGASSDFYRIKHATMHHTYTNVPDEDPDIYESPIVRMSPFQEHHWAHRFQPIYAPFLYMLIGLDWVYRGDFDRAAKLQICSLKMKPLTFTDWMKLFAGKTWHVFFGLVLPSFFHPFWTVLGCYAIALAVTGITLAIVFQLAHVNGRALHPKPDAQTGQIKGGWERHQILTSTDFATQNPLVCWYLGGLNFQVVHHLFAGIHHDHYPAIYRILVDVCRKYDVPYQEFKSTTDAIVGHYREIFRLSRPTTL